MDLAPSGSPAIGVNAQRFDQYVNRSIIGGLFAQYAYPGTPGSFYAYGLWARATSVPGEIGGVRIHRPGTIIGKALEPLAQGTGEILMLLSLQ